MPARVAKDPGSKPQRAPKNPRHRRKGEVSVETSITTETIAAICDALRAGATFETAFAYSKVPPTTARYWMRNGRADDAASIYREFVDQLDLAVADGKMRDLVRIDHHADKDWRAAAWKLERRFPGEFGDPTRNGNVVNVQVTLESERQQTVEALLAAAQRVLADNPDKLEALIAEIGGPTVVDGEAVEVLALEP